jgi:hypothetical protein
MKRRTSRPSASMTRPASLARVRTWWLRRQGLTPDTAPRTIEACVRQVGWLATYGAPGVYLSLRARMPGASRDGVDRAAIDGVPLIEVPGGHARPSVVVPRAEMALALRAHQASYQKHLAPHFRNGDISEAQLRGIGAAVCRALDEGPLSTTDIRQRVRPPGPDALVTVALLDLALRGVVRRFPADGRLDSSKYLYELLHPDDRPDLDAEGDVAAVAAKLVERFLRSHGPATLDELTWWAELTKTVARRALETVHAGRVAIDGWTDEAWLLPDDARAWQSFRPGVTEGGDRVALLPFRDPFISARRGPAVLSASPAVPVLIGNKRPARIIDVDRLDHHAILSGGEVVGVWEYDPKTETVVTRVWRTDRRLKERVAEAAVDTGRFIREQLGDAKLSAVDPPWARERRLAFCRAR